MLDVEKLTNELLGIEPMDEPKEVEKEIKEFTNELAHILVHGSKRKTR